MKQTRHCSFIRFILEYTCVVSDPSTKMLENELESVQCARFVLNNYKCRESMTHVMATFQWTEFRIRRQKEMPET